MNAVDYSKCLNTNTSSDLTQREHKTADTVDIECLKNHLAFIECRIGNEKLQEFHTAAIERNWQGDQKDTSLFQLWYNIYLETNVDESTKETILETEDLTREQQNDFEKEIQVEIDEGLILEGDWIKDLIVDQDLEENKQSYINKEADTLIENNIQPPLEPQKFVNVLQDITIAQIHRENHGENLNTENRHQEQKNDIHTQEKLAQIEKNNIVTELEANEAAEIEANEAVQIKSNLDNNIENVDIKCDLENNRPIDKEGVLNNTENNSNIPSPFKSVLFWPNTSSTSKKISRAKKEIVPSVCSSEKWKQFIEKKEQEKIKKEEGIKERKRLREKNKAEKEEAKKVKANCNEQKINKSKVEAVKRDVFEEKSKHELKINDYVIVQYEGEKYPGVVKKIKEDSVYISSMAISGINKWKWPTPADELWYEIGDVIEKINKPTSVNNRNNYCVPEIEKYHSFLM